MYLRYGKGGGASDPFADYDDWIFWDFENASEWGPGGSAVNLGTKAITVSVENQFLRDTTTFHNGAASGFGDGSNDSFGFSLGGDTMLDMGSSPTCVFEYWIRPTLLPGSCIVFGWGSTANNRFLLNIDSGVPQATTVRGGSVTSRAEGPEIDVDEWSFVRAVLNGGVTTVVVNGVAGDPVAETGAYSVAAFGNAVRWFREPFDTQSYLAGNLDNFKMRVPPA